MARGRTVATGSPGCGHLFFQRGAAEAPRVRAQQPGSFSAETDSPQEREMLGSLPVRERLDSVRDAAGENSGCGVALQVPLT